jgi:hypothetical protein
LPGQAVVLGGLNSGSESHRDEVGAPAGEVVTEGESGLPGADPEDIE